MLPLFYWGVEIDWIYFAACAWNKLSGAQGHTLFYNIMRSHTSKCVLISWTPVMTQTQLQSNYTAHKAALKRETDVCAARGHWEMKSSCARHVTWLKHKCGSLALQECKKYKERQTDRLPAGTESRLYLGIIRGPHDQRPKSLSLWPCLQEITTLYWTELQQRRWESRETWLCIDRMKCIH